MHDNRDAIALYEKLGFQRVPVFCIKRKKPINEPYFTASAPEAKLNPYAPIITDEARRRGIGVAVIDERTNLFRLNHGGRSLTGRESLSELTIGPCQSPRHRCHPRCFSLLSKRFRLGHRSRQ